MQTEIIESELQLLGATKEGEVDLVYGKTFQLPKSDRFIEAKLSFDF